MSDCIPPELITNILARLPGKDVLRCTSVCKSWYELIISPSFASLHLNLSNQEHLVLSRYYKSENLYPGYYLHRDNETFDEIAELDDPISFRGYEWKIVGSLNGLVCLCNYMTGRIALWNPSLRKSIILPNSRVLPDSNPDYRYVIGFGFVAMSNDYKILKFSHSFNYELQADIYKLSTGSWRDLKLEKSVGFEPEYKHAHLNAHLNGILHWFARNQGEFNPAFTKLIFSFDLKNEKFGTLMLPSCLRHDSDDDYYEIYSRLSTFKESLCLIEHGGDRSCTVWVMEEYSVADSWQRLFYINTGIVNTLELLYFKHNGELLFVFTYETGGEHVLVTYDPKNNRIKNVGLHGFQFVLRTYVESVVLIKGPNEVNTDEESPNISQNIQGFSDLLLNQTNETGDGSQIG